MNILLFLGALSMPMHAQSLSSDDLKTEILDFSSRLSSLDCDFVQVKESSLLTEPIVSKGHMAYRKPGYLEWAYVEPAGFTVIADGDDVTIDRDGLTEVLRGNQSRMVKGLTRMIIGNLEGSIFTDEKMFKAELTLADGLITATLIPQKRDYKKIWSKLVLYYDRIAKTATRFEIHEISGDKTIITFSNIRNVFSE